MKLYDADRAYESIKDRIPFRPEIGIVLGSGLGDFVSSVNAVLKIPYSEIESFPVSTTVGHAGIFIFAEYAGHKMVIMSGRIHYYEGYETPETTIPIRVMHLMGINKLFLSNSAGGISDKLNVGSMMIITDHIASLIPTPFRELPVSLFGGKRFYDMSEVYNKELVELLKQAAKDRNIDIGEGVYIQVTGPQYETPAEIRAYKVLGADAVGMSTAVEAMFAYALGIKVCGVSCITNKAAGLGGKLSHDDVTMAADRNSMNLSRLALRFLELLDNDDSANDKDKSSDM